MERNFSQSIISEVKWLIQFIHVFISDCHVMISKTFKLVDNKNLNCVISEGYVQRIHKFLLSVHNNN